MSTLVLFNWLMLLCYLYIFIPFNYYYSIILRCQYWLKTERKEYALG